MQNVQKSVIYNLKERVPILGKIKILKEIEYHPHNILYEATLENGVKILVKDDGSAVGDNGIVYYNVSRSDGDEIDILGWSDEIDGQLFLDQE